MINLIRYELKWAIIFSAFSIVWYFLEKKVGLHDVYFQNYWFCSNLSIIPGFIIVFFALRDIKNNYYKGSISFKNGVVFGIILSLFSAFLVPFVQWINSFVINPDFFKVAIQSSLNFGNYKTFDDAKAYFNFANYVRQGVLGTLAMIIISSTLIMIFMKNEIFIKNKRLNKN